MARNFALHREQQVNGRYRLIQHCGSGTFGDVWLAEVIGDQENLLPHGRRVALKFFHENWEDTPVELLAVQELGPHPNIITVYETGIHAVTLTDETVTFPYLVMEAATKSLSGLMDEQGGRLKDEQSFAMATQVLTALSIACDAGIRHRDIKPDNVLIGSDGLFKVADFGLARWTNRPLTGTLHVSGTPWYMPPEALRNRPVVAQSFDIYGLAVTLYEGLTGHLPFSRDLGWIDLLICKEQNDYTPISVYRPELSEKLWPVLQRALHANPQIRFFDPREFAEALDEVFSADPVRSDPSFQETISELLTQGLVSDAIGLLARRISEEPRDYESALLLGRLYLQGGDTEHAGMVWRQAISQVDDGADDLNVYHLLLSLANLDYSRKGFSQAAQLYSRAASLQRNALYPLCLAGVCYALNAQFASAAVHLERAYELAPHLPMLGARLGFIYWQLRQYHKATDTWEGVLSIQSNDHRTRLELVRLYLLLKQADRGIHHAELLQRLAPNSPESKEAIRLYGISSG